MARQIGKMLHAREPKIINGPGETYVWVFACLKMQCACENTDPCTLHCTAVYFVNTFETSASGVVLSMQLYFSTQQCSVFTDTCGIVFAKRACFSRFQNCDILEV